MSTRRTNTTNTAGTSHNLWLRCWPIISSIIIAAFLVKNICGTQFADWSAPLAAEFRNIHKCFYRKASERCPPTWAGERSVDLVRRSRDQPLAVRSKRRRQRLQQRRTKTPHTTAGNRSPSAPADTTTHRFLNEEAKQTAQRYSSQYYTERCICMRVTEKNKERTNWGGSQLATWAKLQNYLLQ